jgi:hypothetical protein
MIYVSDSRDVAGAVRRSKRLHWKQEGARQEVEGWVTQVGFDPVRWEIADDETLVGRIPGHSWWCRAFCCRNSSEHLGNWLRGRRSGTRRLNSWALILGPTMLALCVTARALTLQ